MGRPIKKTKMSIDNTLSGTNEALSGKLAVTAYRPYGGAKVDSTTAYIVSQRGSKKFKIHLEDSTEETMLLKAVAPGSLANDNVNGMGEFCVQVILDDSTVAYVEKFYNNTIHYVESDGTTTGTVKYTLGAEGTDEGAVANLGSIDVR
jgi:hypothetical protein